MLKIPVHIVGCENSARSSLGYRLHREGHDVRYWASGGSFVDGISNYQPGLVLLDAAMTDMDGLTTLAWLRAKSIVLPVAALTVQANVRLAVRIVKAGAFDLVETPVTDDKLSQLIEFATAWLDEFSARLNRQRAANLQLASLTAREREILSVLAAGHPNKSIAQKLGISTRTVEVHRAHLKTKLAARTSTDLLKLAFAAGLGRAADSLQPAIANSRIMALDCL